MLKEIQTARLLNVTSYSVSYIGIMCPCHQSKRGDLGLLSEADLVQRLKSWAIDVLARKP